MNQLQIFENSEFGQIRTLEENGMTMFCGSDVARALGYDQPHKAIERHCKDGGTLHTVIDSMGREQQAKFINEGNLYRLIINSKLPSAEKFERWVFDEVLPTIRKHGAYMTTEKLEAVMNDPDAWITLLTTLKSERQQKLQLQAENSIMLPKAEYFDQLVDKNLLTNFRETAKELRIKEREFVAYLVNHKYVYRDKKGKLQPYAQKNSGLFELKECVNQSTGWGGTQTLITPKGRETFRLLLKGAYSEASE